MQSFCDGTLFSIMADPQPGPSGINRHCKVLFDVFMNSDSENDSDFDIEMGENISASDDSETGSSDNDQGLMKTMI